MKLWAEYDDDEIIKEANKLDKIRRKLKIKHLIKGTEEKINKSKIRKLEFQQNLKITSAKQN